MEIVYRARDITEAEIVAGMLQANGVEAHVSGYYLQGGVGELAAMGFANVLVDRARLARARELVATYEGAAANEEDRVGARATGIAARVVVAAVLALVVLAVYLVAAGR